MYWRHVFLLLALLLSTQFASGQVALVDYVLVNEKNVPTQRFTPPDAVRVEIRPLHSHGFAARLQFTLILPNNHRQLLTTLDYCREPLKRPEAVTLMLVDDQTLKGKYALVIEAFDCTRWTKLDTRVLEFSVESPFPPITLELVLALVAAVVAIAVAVAYVRERPKASALPPPAPPPPPPPPPREPTAVKPGSAPGATSVGTPLAFLELPNGVQIPITTSSRDFGRDDFSHYLPPDTAQYISARHFRIYYSAGKWYIEDLKSTNGTIVDGREIRGAGPVELKPGSVIQPAGTIKLTFRPAA